MSGEEVKKQINEAVLEKANLEKANITTQEILKAGQNTIRVLVLLYSGGVTLLINALSQKSLSVIAIKISMFFVMVGLLSSVISLYTYPKYMDANFDKKIEKTFRLLFIKLPVIKTHNYLMLLSYLMLAFACFAIMFA